MVILAASCTARYPELASFFHSEDQQHNRNETKPVNHDNQLYNPFGTTITP
jgi:hypothetical protein